MNQPTMTTDENGNKFWLNSNGDLHREDGPAVIKTNGIKEWWVNGERHREDGPAFEDFHGNYFWYQNRELHRTDGPAVEWEDGDKAWFLNGKQVTEQDVMG